MKKVYGAYYTINGKLKYREISASSEQAAKATIMHLYPKARGIKVQKPDIDRSITSTK